MGPQTWLTSSGFWASWGWRYNLSILVYHRNVQAGYWKSSYATTKFPTFALLIWLYFSFLFLKTQQVFKILLTHINILYSKIWICILLLTRCILSHLTSTWFRILHWLLILSAYYIWLNYLILIILLRNNTSIII